MKKLIYTTIILCFALTISAEQKMSNYNQKIIEKINNIADSIYKDIVTKYGIKKYKGWELPIANTFATIKSRAKYPDFGEEYSIVEDKQFNCETFSSGKFIITTGLLDTLDKEVDKELRPPMTKDFLRERYISVILSHELAHYYRNHSYQQYLENSQYNSKDELKEDEIRNELKHFKFRQEQEKEADQIGYTLLDQKYRSEDTVKVLKILKEVENESQKNPLTGNHYFQTHPSTNERLVWFTRGDEKQYYQSISTLEKLFANIELGRNLQETHRDIENLLKKNEFKENPSLLKAKAICKHKMWLKSAKPKDIKLRTIVEVSPFSEDMVHSDTSSMAGERIPGNSALYYQAIDEYEEAYKYNLGDIQIMSDYATLLVYGNETKDTAIMIAKNASKNSDSTLVLNNLGLVYYIAGYEDAAIEVFSNLNREIDSIDNLIYQNVSPIEYLSMKDKVKKYIRRISHFDSSYVFSDCNPKLNLSLLLKDKNIAKDYFNLCDTSSDWARHLSQTTKQKITNRELNVGAKINGITLGVPYSDLLKEWGEPSKKKIGVITELLYYKNFTEVIVGDNKVVQISLTKKGLKVNDKIGVGSSQSELEKMFGAFTLQKGSYFVYPSKNGIIVVEYGDDKNVKKLSLVADKLRKK